MIRYQENGAVPATVNTGEARLPASYEAAKQALANCEQIDECVTWADKAAALASYAKQAKDDELMKRSTRIRDRAIRRAGELLKQIEPAKGVRTDLEHRGGTTPMLTRKQAAEEAGLSNDQMKQAIRVANVPSEEFERQVESANPPTVTKLAEQGKQVAPAPKPVIDLKGRDPAEFNKALHFVAEFEAYQRSIEKIDTDTVLTVLNDSERARVRKAIAAIDAVHDRIITRI